jgi:hypothetical protein
MSAPTIAVPGSVHHEAETQRTIQSQQDIASLAYVLWQQRGCPEGSAEQDWIEAERKLRQATPAVARR